MNFRQRSDKTEILDDPSIPFADIRQNMQELDFINTWLGGHQITIAGVKKLAGSRRSFSVCEIGCGGGDNLLAIHRWAQKNGFEVSLAGIDINQNCIDVAKDKLSGLNAELISSSYELAIPSSKPDIIFSSLFCHHFSDEQLCFMMKWMADNASLGFFINDLHRHPLAFYSIRGLTAAFSKSYMVRNDAPLSVLRGFSRKDWRGILGKAGVVSYDIKWKWAFRWLVTSANS